MRLAADAFLDISRCLGGTAVEVYPAAHCLVLRAFIVQPYPTAHPKKIVLAQSRVSSLLQRGAPTPHLLLCFQLCLLRPGSLRRVGRDNLLLPDTPRLPPPAQAQAQAGKFAWLYVAR